MLLGWHRGTQASSLGLAGCQAAPEQSIGPVRLPWKPRSASLTQGDIDFQTGYLYLLLPVSATPWVADFHIYIFLEAQFNHSTSFAILSRFPCKEYSTAAGNMAGGGVG